jgi:predicted outer membrane repeat protein
MSRSAAPCLALVTILVSALVGAAAPAGAATFAVDTTADTADALPGDGVCADAGGACSLRAALMETNALAGADEITLPAGTYGLAIPAGGADTDASGDLDVTDALTIQGAGADLTILDGNLQSRVLEVASMSASFPVELRDLTITRGRANETALPSGGGGILNRGSLTVLRCRIRQNQLQTGEGGGIHSASNVLLVFDSSFEDNVGNVRGGGLHLSGTNGAQVHRTTFTGNSADSGGAIALATGTNISVSDSTIAGNNAWLVGGGGIDSELNSSVFLFGSTVTGNFAALWGGGVFNNSGTTNFFVANTILADNVASISAPDCWGSIRSKGYNLIESTQDCTLSDTLTGNVLGVDPQLGPLADHGGLGQSRLPAVGSPAVDAGSPLAPGSDTWSCSPLDQRGVARPRDGDGDATARCDIGAVELGRYDAGDAPDPDYPTLLASDGARHLMAGTLWLGARRDDDADGQPDAAAAGDDGALSDDEDGVDFPQLLTGESPVLAVTSTGAGLLDAWIDFDQDGIWMEGDERVVTGVALAAGANAVAIDVPADATVGFTFARFRVSTAGGLAPNGAAADGEVEDFRVRIEQLVFASPFESGFDGWDAVFP